MGAYILASLIFVVAAVFQMAILLILKQKSDGKVRSLEKDIEATNKKTIEFQKFIKRIDWICLILFPFLFTLFNAIYWAIVL